MWGTFTERVRAKLGDSDKNPTQMIVNNYGLLEPQLKLLFEPGMKARDIFIMKPAQQLVALTMLGMDASFFLGASPFGFEVLSTNIAKCAIAATSVIEDEKRPTLQKALQTIGFEIDERATSDSIKEEWKNLDKIKVVENIFDCVGEDEETLIANAMKTRPMNVELRQFCGDDTDENLLQIDSMASKTLKAMKPREKDGEFGLPSAWINYGPSPLADGFVTFYCQRTTGTTVTADSAFRFTLMNQAKDYHNGGSKLHTKKLNERAVRCSAPVLDGVFGKRRLLCVAGSKDVVVAKVACAQKRNFMPYAFDSGRILKGLLKTLESQRNLKTRMLINATFCTGDGEDVSEKYGLKRRQPGDIEPNC